MSNSVEKTRFDGVIIKALADLPEPMRAGVSKVSHKTYRAVAFAVESAVRAEQPYPTECSWCNSSILEPETTYLCQTCAAAQPQQEQRAHVWNEHCELHCEAAHNPPCHCSCDDCGYPTCKKAEQPQVGHVAVCDCRDSMNGEAYPSRTDPRCLPGLKHDALIAARARVEALNRLAMDMVHTEATDDMSLTVYRRDEARAALAELEKK